MQDAAGDRGCPLQRVHGGHAVIDHQLELARIFAVREDADVAAAQDGDAGVERGFEAGALACDAGRLSLFPLLPARILACRIAGRERGTEHDVFFRHHLEDLGGTAVAVLDRVHSSQNRVAHAFDRARVC